MESPSIFGSALKGNFLVGAQFEEAADAGDEVDDVLLRERVVERASLHRVADFLEFAGGLRPTPLNFFLK